MDIKIGADPEVFIRDKKTKKFLAALDIPGSKTKPHPLKKGAVQRDGVALEFNIDPASTAQEFSDNIEIVFEQCKKFIPDTQELVAQPSVTFDKEYFYSLDKSILELGCDRDYDAYSGNVKPIPRSRDTRRTGAGHIHLGWTSDADPLSSSHMWDCRELVKRLDAYFQPFKSYWDTDTNRELLYGAPGSFRPKSYGLEYRVPSNAWLNHKELWPWLFESVSWVFYNGISGKRFNPAGFLSHWNSKGRTLDQQYEAFFSDIRQVFSQEDAPRFPLTSAVQARLDGTR